MLRRLQTYLQQENILFNFQEALFFRQKVPIFINVNLILQLFSDFFARRKQDYDSRIIHFRLEYAGAE